MAKTTHPEWVYARFATYTSVRTYIYIYAPRSTPRCYLFSKLFFSRLACSLCVHPYYPYPPAPPPGEIVARIPTSRCLTRLDCVHHETVSKLRTSIGDEKEWLAELGAALLLERIDIKNSPLLGYLNSLPQREKDVVASWPDGQKRFLTGTDVDRALRDERAAARAEWERYVRPEISKLKLSDDSLTFENYLDARSVISSRAFSVTHETGPGLVPIADLFNHKTGDNHVVMRLVDETRAEDGSESKNEKTLVAEIKHSVKKNQEVFNTYGHLGNAVLLNSYGFCQENNPADVVTVTVPDVRASAAMTGISGSAIAKTLNVLISENVFTENEMFALSKESPPPTGLLVALWAVMTEDAEFTRVQQEVSRVRVEPTSEQTDSASRWKHAVEKKTTESTESPGLQTLEALGVFVAILERRRSMYKYVPDGDAESSSSWKRSLKILVDSERSIIEHYLKRAKDEIVLNEKRGGEQKIRKTEEPAKKEDAFALFD